MQSSTRPASGRLRLLTVMGVGQIFGWGTSYYLLAVLAKPIAAETGWPLPWVVGGVSLGLLIAAILSPWTGARIARKGGRGVLAASSLLFAAGLATLGVAPNLPVYLAGWLVVGLAMGTGLYDAGFGTLGRLYGAEARSSITALTLFGGLASTTCWPLSALLETHLGWRGACFAYAGFHVLVMLPAYLLTVPTVPSLSTEPVTRETAPRDRSLPDHGKRLFGLLAATTTLSAVILTVLSVHLLAILQSRGSSLGEAVALGALVGPAQVTARFIEFSIARRHHPIWTKVTSTILMALGVACLWAALPILAIPLLLYGAGIGLDSIARGTLPLVLFAGPRYPIVMGRLAVPSLVAQAAAPLIGASLLDAYGAGGTLASLTGAAILNVGLVFVLVGLIRRPA